MTTYTTEQLNNQRFSLMSTIKGMENELSEAAIDKMYAKVFAINNEIESRNESRVSTDSMHS